jgi:Fur family transcriptional regulator, ferric uptake regulator
MTHKNIATADEMLREAGLYSTHARISIVEALLESGHPMDKREIAAHLGKKGPDEVTIYRTLESLCNKGLVHKVFAEGRSGRYEMAHNCGHVQCHPHFTCRRCGVTECLTGVTIPLAKGLRKGFKLLRQQVRLEGICPACSGLVK